MSNSCQGNSKAVVKRPSHKPNLSHSDAVMETINPLSQNKTEKQIYQTTHSKLLNKALHKGDLLCVLLCQVTCLFLTEKVKAEKTLSQLCKVVKEGFYTCVIQTMRALTMRNEPLETKMTPSTHEKDTYSIL